MDMVTKTENKKQQAAVGRAFDMYDWVGTAIFSLVMIVVIFTLLFRIVGVDGDSMKNTLQNGDRLILTSSLGYTPERGDIVVVNRYTDEPLVKRIIALEGETIEITTDGRVLVNNKEVDEDFAYFENPHLGTPAKDLVIPQTVPAGCVFVMGDNRQNSHDSRAADIGFVSVEDIVGEAVFRLWPFDTMGVL